MSLHVPLMSVFALELGASTLEVGVLGGSGPLLYAAVTLLSGLLVSRLGGRLSVALSLALLSLSYFLAVEASSVLQLLVVAALALVAYAVFWPAIESAVSRSGSVEAFSASWSVGALAGSALAACAIDAGPRLSLSAMSLASVLAAIASLLIEEGKTEASAASLSAMVECAVKGAESWTWALSYAVAQGSVFVFYPVIVEAYGLPSWYVSVTLTAVTGIRTIVFALRNRIPPALRSPAVGALAILPSSLLVFTRDALTVAALSAFLGLGAGILYTSSLDRVFDSDPSDRPLYAGMFESSIGLGYAVGPLLAGLASSATLKATLPVAVAFAAASSLVAYARTKRGPRQ